MLVQLTDSISVFNGDCVQLVAELGASLSAVIEIVDPPYGVTDHEWDRIVPASSWMRGRGTVAFAAEPYATHLITTAPQPFMYDQVWVKNCTSNHMNASRQPLRRHERVLVFGAPPYTPQKRKRSARELARLNKVQREKYQERNPDTVLEFDSVNCRSGERTAHPSQKPIELLDHLVRTYTLPGDTIFDPFMGSGTTAVAVLRVGEGRKFIGAELNPEFYALTVERIRRGVRAISNGEEAR